MNIKDGAFMQEQTKTYLKPAVEPSSGLDAEWEAEAAFTGSKANDAGPAADTKTRQAYAFAKRTMDLMCSLAALIMLAVPMALIALIIYIDSPKASPIFVQQRVGKDGKIFNLYKFRSMIPQAEQHLEELLDQNEMDGPVFKIKQDPRITRVGRVIRKTSIDELPQLFNIIKGDMSIVGPRPALPREVEQYGEREKQRLRVKPGLTCYWQIQPERNTLSFEEWLSLDLQYIEERSIKKDWQIIFKTIGVVLHADGV